MNAAAGQSAHLTRTVTTRDGVALAVRDYGSTAAGHTVVLLHGLCMNKDAWNIQVAQLISQWGDDVRIISYDHRGHGDSAEAPIHTYRVDQLADDLAGLLVALKVTGKLTLVGHSLGGMTALAYLGRPAHLRPVEPRDVVLVATAAGKLTQRGVPRLLKTRLSDVTCAVGHRFPWLTRAVVGLLGRPVSQLLKIWAEPSLGGALHTTAVPTKLGFLQGLKVYDHYATLPTITAATTIISGGVDRLTPAAHSLDMAAAIPGARLIHRPAAGHVVLHEEPQVVTDAISATIGAAIPARRTPLLREVDARRYDYASLVTEPLRAPRGVCANPAITRPLRRYTSPAPFGAGTIAATPDELAPAC